MDKSNDPNKIYFSLPGFTGQRQQCTGLILDMMQLESHKFNSDVVIDSVYDSWDCVWNGGRGSGGSMITDEVRQCVEYYKNKGISLRNTYTNSLINEGTVLDTTGNAILRLTQLPDKMNGVTVNSTILANYIKENYPDFYIVWSTTLGKNPIEKINELTENDLMVLYYGLNNEFEQLKKLGHPEHVEILATEACVDKCTQRQKHYLSMDKYFMHAEQFQEEPFRCPYDCERYFYYEKPVNRRHHVTLEQMRNEYRELGINHFKISGRNDSPINLCENYVNYLVKPEYRDDVRNRFLNVLFGGPMQQGAVSNFGSFNAPQNGAATPAGACSGSSCSTCGGC